MFSRVRNNQAMPIISRKKGISSSLSPSQRSLRSTASSPKKPRAKGLRSQTASIQKQAIPSSEINIPNRKQITSACFFMHKTSHPDLLKPTKLFAAD